MSLRKGGPEGFRIHEVEIPKLDEITDSEIISETVLGNFESSKPESTESRLAAIEHILTNPEAFIDKGGAGSVYRLSNEAACLKLFHPHKDVERRKTGVNIIRREAALTQSLESFTRAGVRSPRCLGYYIIDEQDGRSGIVLEQLDAINLQHILAGTAEAPETFNKGLFMNALQEYIDALHEEKNLVHGDLFARNIMVDRQTGSPRVIDFGETKNLRPLTPQERNRKIDEELTNLDAIDSELFKKLT